MLNDRAPEWVFGKCRSSGRAFLMIRLPESPDPIRVIQANRLPHAISEVFL